MQVRQISASDCETLDFDAFYADEKFWYQTLMHCIGTRIPWHYGLKLLVLNILNFPLESPSQVAPKIFCLVEQCKTKNPPGIEADSILEEF